MRLFLGIEIPESIKTILWDQLDLLRKEHPEYQWIPKENYHITLDFLGEQYSMQEIIAKVDSVLFDMSDFYLYGRTLNVFLDKNIKIFVEFYRQKKLEELYLKIKNHIPVNKYAKDDFIPHISISQSRPSSKQQYFALQKKLSKIEIDIEFQVKKIVLFQSIVINHTRTFKKEKVFFLGK
ncbi:RNA 2',3'-cyclic phosphodiesterase [Candidatus Roizmanbacteria bacterium CG_4_10_14_0_8_um_filter_33_9]|uniref:RNA 2',3'-cyclic phosphodiesterase n=1 Tax=Candidatus Roizmanbacteria bacterium CG_4_10_14_0_8_um_filter_33_9 TaxID=1974826 RepID=A0A2M7QJA6_9BACT|nr:MAG: RNA 2',3'-cyclic phosphodiesterase [Candidatus Roizmanbacteria bacterium CG_4_10_14_0_8_um_filter_33_9]